MYSERLNKLREEMKSNEVQGFLVPQTDKFMGEYIPECYQRVAWLSGFTGSSGILVVLEDKALALTNSIYTLQIRKEVSADLYEYGDVMSLKAHDWIKHNTNDGDVIAYDPWLHTHAEIKTLIDNGVNLKPIDDNLIDKIWNDQPELPEKPVFLHGDKIVGRTSKEKRALVADELKKEETDLFVLADPQSIAWLLNVRGTDVPCTPLPLSYAVIYQDSTVDWFIDTNRIPKDVCNHLGDDITIVPPSELTSSLSDVLSSERVGVDHKRAPIAFRNILDNGSCEIVDSKDPCIDIRACKTDAEINAVKAAHIRDGRALTKALNWIEQESTKGDLTEIDVDKKLYECRNETNALQDLSFESIVGWSENGAIVHYRVSEESSLPIKGQGLLLIDSGGQYTDGTTDVTRTIALGGEPTAEQKRNFTLVLKGHIGVATAIFPEGTTGAQIDLLARKALWAEGLDYGHGTGHGVGCYLSVHEEATSISPREQGTFKAGMVVSNEPGYYKEGEYGIRIESLVVVVETGVTLADGRKMLGFETITMVPLDEKLIDWDILTEDEAQWVMDYQDQVQKALS